MSTCRLWDIITCYQLANSFVETDGKDVKPYQGTEAGQTDYANAHDGHNKNQGERFKTSKRKNKGRKVSVRQF